MIRSSYSVSFFVRKDKMRKDGTVPIEVSIVLNQEKTSFSTGKKVLFQNWDKIKQQVKGNNDEANALNQFIKSVRTAIYQKESDLLERGFVITADLLKDAYFNKVGVLQEKTFFEVFLEHNQQQQGMVGNGISKSTHWVSEYSLRLCKDYLKENYQRKDIYLRELNINFIKGFHVYLLRRMGQNSCSKHLKLLKKIVNIACANSYMTFNPFMTYKVERTPVEIEFLDEEELRRIINYDFVLPRLEKARDFFLFGCFTGLSYIDVKTLKPEHFERDKEGRVWIKKRRVKTDVLARVPLLPMAKMILEKYKGSGKLLPIQDPADINKYLKDIAILCNIVSPR